MENRTYTLAFMGVLAIVCLGAYVAMSALFDVNGDPLVRFDSATANPTAVAQATRATATRTTTPTNTPFVLVGLPTVAVPTATPILPTPTSTIPPLPSPRPLPTRTPTVTPVPSDTATPLPPSATPPPAPPPGGYAYGFTGPSVEQRNCVSQYIIYGYVRDAQGQGVAAVRIRFVARFPHPIEFPTASTRSGSEAGYYELTGGTSGNEFDVTLIDAGDQPLSPTVHVSTSGFENGNCWYQLNWRRN